MAVRTALGFLLVLLAGCEQPAPHALRFGLSSSPVTLDPRYATDAASTRINRLLYCRLVDFDESFKPGPSLAEWRRLSPKHYRFSLKQSGRTFHHGGRLTAKDVRATYASILDPANASPHRGSLAVIARIVVIDDDTVDFHLTTPDPLFPGRLVLGILPKSLLDKGHRFGKAPVGSGPFIFVDWPEENRLRLKRSSDGRLVEFLRVSDPTVRVLKLVRGEIDMLQGDLPPELIAWLDGRESVNVEQRNGTNFAYLGFNMDDPVAGDPLVRRAIGHALDRAAIIEHVIGGAARPATAILPPSHWAGHPNLPSLEHDPRAARRLLEEAGYDGARQPRLVYKTSNDPFRVRLATIVQDQLNRAGIEVDLRSYDWGTFYGDVKAGRFQMYSLAWVGVKMPDIFKYVFHSRSVPPAGANRGRFRSALADRLIEKAGRTESLAVQAELYRELQEHLLKELPYIPLWYEDHVFVARSDIRNYTLAADGNYDGLKEAMRVVTR